MGAAAAIRQLVHGHATAVDAKLAQGREATIADIDIEIEDKV